MQEMCVFLEAPTWLTAKSHSSTGVIGPQAESRYVVAQGTRFGRKGRVYLSRDDVGQVLVGGETHSHVQSEQHSF